MKEKYFDIKVATIIFRFSIDDIHLYNDFSKKYKIYSTSKKNIPTYIFTFTKKDGTYKISTDLFECIVSERYKFDNLNFIIKCLVGFHLLKHNILLFHGSSIAIKNSGYAFFGKSGAGKTTLLKNTSTNESVSVLSEDSTIIHIGSKNSYFFCSPFDYKYRYEFSDKPTVASSIFFLKKSVENHQKAVHLKESLSGIIRNNFLNMFLYRVNIDTMHSNDDTRILPRKGVDINILIKQLNTNILRLASKTKIKKLFFKKDYVFYPHE